MAANPKICIAGAGSIGCFVGGLLLAAGKPVSFLGRARLLEEIKSNGLKITSFEPIEHRLSYGEFRISDDPEILRDTDVILITVKSDATPQMADLIAAHAKPDAVVVSFQNGVGNVPVLRGKLPGRNVLAGMVPFNVIALGDGHFHRASSGDILIESDDAETATRLRAPGLRMKAADNMLGVQWGKLLINLNNALNALSGIPLRDQLEQRSWRALFADQMSEGLAALKAEGIRPVASTPLPSSATPHILKLPDTLFRMIARPMVKIDPKARSSMWQDLQRGRHTEIDHLQGLIVRMSKEHGLNAPLSARVLALIKDAERAGKGSPGLTPEQIRGS